MLNLTMTRMRTMAWNLTITQGDPPAPVDLTGKVVWFFAKKLLSDPDSDAVIRKNSDAVGGIEITDSTHGLAKLNMFPPDTVKVQLKESVVLQCSLVLVDSTNVYELDSGTLTISGNVEIPK